EGGSQPLLVAADGFLDPRGAARAPTEVVEARAADSTATGDGQRVQARAVERVGPLHPDAGGDAADREVPGRALLHADDHTLEGLEALAGALDNAGHHTDGVAGAELGQFGHALRTRLGEFT